MKEEAKAGREKGRRALIWVEVRLDGEATS